MSMSMSSRPKYWPCSILIITTSPSTSAVRTEGLRGYCLLALPLPPRLLGPQLISACPRSRDRAKPAPPLFIAAFDPADEPADMNASCQREPVFADTALGGLRVLWPLRHQALEARQIDQPARQRRSLQALDFAADVYPFGVERTKPGRIDGA